MLKKRILLEDNKLIGNDFVNLLNLNKSFNNKKFNKIYCKENNDEIFISKISNDNNHFNTTFKKQINISKEINVSDFNIFTKRKFSQLNKNSNDFQFKKIFKNNI